MIARPPLPRWLAPLGLGIASLGCSGKPGSIGRILHPRQTSAAEALGDPPAGEVCHDVSGSLRPLVVDLRPEQRGDLEVAMREGLALVRYDCDGLQLLPECSADGTYGFKGIVLKQQLIRLTDEAEVRANLPLTGLALAARLGAELDRGSSLDLATAWIGNLTSTRQRLDRSDLSGACDGASHFVRGANIGAFVMQSGTETEQTSAALLFGVGAGQGSTSSHVSRVEDGRLEDCERSDPDSSAPPGNCRALIRLHLIPITEQDPAAEAPSPPTGRPAAPDPLVSPPATSITAPSSLEEDPGCPEGLVLSEGKCVPPEKAKTHVCTGDDPADCRAQCDAGEPGSCARLASLYARGSGLTVDLDAAAALYQRACEQDHATACSRLGILAAQGRGAPRDEARAAQLFERACRLGEADGCFNLGVLCFDGAGLPRDAARAFTLFQQACDAGKAVACVNVGTAYDDGEGVASDPAQAFAHFKRACEGDVAAGCYNLGYLYARGRGIAVAQDLAARAYARACELGSGEGCHELGERARTGNGREQSEAEARRLFARGCELGDATACAKAKP